MKYLMLLLAVSLLVAGSAAADVTVTFQQGVGGYTGTVDTWVTNQAPDDNTKGASAQLQVKNDGGQIRQTLVRFDSVFGSVVPTGVTIQSATLTVVSDGGSGGGTYLHKMLVTWSGTSTYNTLVSGVDDPGEYDTTPISTNSGVVSGTPVSYDVKSVVQAWSNDPASNFGFVWLSQGASHYFRSSEYGTATDRPLLTVTFSEFQITAFAVQGALTGSSKWTDSATVYVTLTATTTPDAAVTGYLVTETSATPALADPNWQPSVTSYTILAGEGIATLYAWAKDDQDRIAGKTAVIGYSTTSPAISDVVATAGNEVLKVTWTTNASAVGWVEYGPEGGELSSATSLDYGTSHSATITGLTQGATYDYVVHSNGAATDTASATTRLAQTIT